MAASGGGGIFSDGLAAARGDRLDAGGGGSVFSDGLAAGGAR